MLKKQDLGINHSILTGIGGPWVYVWGIRIWGVHLGAYCNRYSLNEGEIFTVGGLSEQRFLFMLGLIMLNWNFNKLVAIYKIFYTL